MSFGLVLIVVVAAGVPLFVMLCYYLSAIVEQKQQVAPSAFAPLVEEPQPQQQAAAPTPARATPPKPAPAPARIASPPAPQKEKESVAKLSLELAKLPAAEDPHIVIESEKYSDSFVPPKVRRLRAWWRGVGVAEVMWNSATGATGYAVTVADDTQATILSQTTTQTLIAFELDPKKGYSVTVEALRDQNRSDSCATSLPSCDIDLTHEEAAVDKMVERMVQSFAAVNLEGKTLTVRKTAKNQFAIGSERVQLTLKAEGCGQVSCRTGGGFLELGAWLVRHKSSLSRSARAQSATESPRNISPGRSMSLREPPSPRRSLSPQPASFRTTPNLSPKSPRHSLSSEKQITPRSRHSFQHGVSPSPSRSRVSPSTDDSSLLQKRSHSTKDASK